MASEERSDRPADILLFLSRCAFFGAAASTVTAFVVVYRLWALAYARTPDGFPGGWIFGLGEVATQPFRRVEPFTATKETGYLDFPAVVALDVYLVATLVFAFLGFLLSTALSSPAGASDPLAVDQKVARPRQPSRLRPWLMGIGAAVGRSSATGMELIRAHDWAGDRAALHARWQLASSWLLLHARRLYVAVRDGLGRDWDSLGQYLQSRLPLAGRSRSEWAIRARQFFNQIRSRIDSELHGQQASMRAQQIRRSALRCQIACIRGWRQTAPLLREGRLRGSSTAQQFGRGMQTATRLESSLYWNSLAALSRQPVLLTSNTYHFAREKRRVANQQSLIAAPNDHFSRREFFRRVMPTR